MNAKLLMVVRILLGLVLIIFGANKFANFMPAGEMPEAAGNFFGAMVATGFMIPLIAIVEIVVGALLVLNKWVPFALTALVPLSVGFVLFHLALAPAGILPAAVVVILHILLLFSYKDKLKPLFS
ncbi:MAG: DoxX family membrane protein [Bacteroidetes bacterium]|nr:DoxX family membrane protein [Bacteroidota bacterium]